MTRAIVAPFVILCAAALMVAVNGVKYAESDLEVNAESDLEVDPEQFLIKWNQGDDIATKSKVLLDGSIEARSKQQQDFLVLLDGARIRARDFENKYDGWYKSNREKCMGESTEVMLQECEDDETKIDAYYELEMSRLLQLRDEERDDHVSDFKSTAETNRKWIDEMDVSLNNEKILMDGELEKLNKKLASVENESEKIKTKSLEKNAFKLSRKIGRQLTELEIERQKIEKKVNKIDEVTKTQFCLEFLGMEEKFTDAELLIIQEQITKLLNYKFMIRAEGGFVSDSTVIGQTVIVGADDKRELRATQSGRRLGGGDYVQLACEMNCGGCSGVDMCEAVNSCGGRRLEENESSKRRRLGGYFENSLRVWMEKAFNRDFEREEVTVVPCS